MASAPAKKIKQKLWFDPKNPPKTPVYIGQRIPIYIVPDDTEEDDRLPEPTWRKTEWVFTIVDMRRDTIITENGDEIQGEVVDVEWPNGHIDTGIPIKDMYGRFARIRESWIPKYTEPYDSDDDDDVEIIDFSKAQTNQEKLEQLLKMLEFLSVQRERLIEDENKPTVAVEETTDEPTILNNMSDEVGVTIVEPKPAKKTIEPKPADDEIDVTGGITTKMVESWFRMPKNGGLYIGDLRKKASEMGIKNPEKINKKDLRVEMLKLTA